MVSILILSQFIKANRKYKSIEILNFFISKDGSKITESHISNFEEKGVVQKRLITQQSFVKDPRIAQSHVSSYSITGSI